MPANFQHNAVPVLRFGLVILFLWFGLSQVTNPGGWVSWVPEWAGNILPPQMIVLLNGGFEVVAGLALAAGFFTRIASALLAVHLVFIAWEIGYNDIGVRDFVLAIATLSLALFDPDRFTIDSKYTPARSHEAM